MYFVILNWKASSHSHSSKFAACTPNKGLVTATCFEAVHTEGLVGGPVPATCRLVCPDHYNKLPVITDEVRGSVAMLGFCEINIYIFIFFYFKYYFYTVKQAL